MKILIAPDSFKGSLSALEVAQSIEMGILKVFPKAEVFKVPIADGGEGTIEAILTNKRGEKIEVLTQDALERPLKASYALLKDEPTAIVEMATASGLPLLTKEERNPLKTSTFGTGILIKNAIEKLNQEYAGARKKVIVFIGGSATNDAGAGMLQALGIKFLDSAGKEIQVNGGNLKEIKKIENVEIVEDVEFTVACDVTNPLLGAKGASAVFAPQKGATPDIVKVLEENLSYFAELVETTFPILRGTHLKEGTGAAGGLSYGLVAFLDAKLEKGIDIVLKTIELEKIIASFSPQNRDLVITGEGAMDFQTAFGKAPWGVAQLAKKYQLPVIGIAGGLGKEYQTLYEHGFDSLFSLTDKPMSLEEAIENAPLLLESIAERVMRVYQMR
jgi:glycerate 2-kinase